MKWLKKALGQAGRERAEELVTQGFVQRREGRLDEALRSYLDAVEADETLAVAHLNEGLCRLDLYNRDLNHDGADDDDDARVQALAAIAACLDRSLLLDDKSAVGWRALANIEERRNAYGRVEDCWKKVRQYASAEGKEQHEADQKLKDIAIKALIDRARRRAIAASEIHVDEAEKKAALAELLTLIEQHPSEVERGHALAGALARRAHDSRAREILEKAVAADAHDVDALRDLAGVCLDSGDLAAALRHSVTAYRERPTDVALVCNVGVCHLGLLDVDQAAEYIDIAARLEPKDPIVQRAVSALKQARATR